MSTTYNHRKGSTFRSAMARSAKRRTCPECGRKSAIKRWSDEIGTYAECRWCDYTAATTWDELYAKADAARAARGEME
jgi:ribosomal protein L37AE/L43A